MEEHKLQYLKSLLGQNIEVKKCVAAVEPLEAIARKCYAEPIDLSPQEFVKMMVFDGCFIIQLLRKFNGENVLDENDPIFKQDWILNSLQRDLMLLENQLPFFILCELYETLELPDKASELIRLALNFFSDLLPVQRITHENGNPREDISHLLDEKGNPLKDISHLLDLIHRDWSSKLEPQQDVNRSTGEYKSIRCSTQLTEAGIKLKKIDYKDIFGIQFDHGSLQIPTLVIEERTESFLRNLIAHEQYRGGDQINQINIVTDYVTFLGCLIKSEEDVTKLSHRGIICNLVGEDEVISEMVNKLIVCITGPSRNFYYAEIFRRLNIHCNRPGKRWMAKLRRNYCNSPWKIISIIVACLLLLLALLQTIFSILSWKKQ
ncbi:unnamed protein product [Coffea canephora]|uniref:Uncharacterized protein n=1 Tax=Coffea canephora TaxID=49390 RepID=A0A068URJ3_COFCA|nr:unnamed protein product [Coffea canephora]